MTTVAPAVAPAPMSEPTFASATPVTLSPGHRLVPATIGRPGCTQVVWIECPNWCRHDHLADREVAIEDIDHYSTMDGWRIDSMLSPGEEIHSLYVRVHSDPSHEDVRLRASHVLIGNGAPFDSYLTADAAEAAADELDAFVEQIRAAARTVRMANQDITTAA